MGYWKTDLSKLFKASSSITFIGGRRGFGKTSMALKLGEFALQDKLINKLGGNIRTYTPDPRLEYIPYYDTLVNWLQTKGKKIYILDELGKNLNRMEFMTKTAKKILDICQLARKYDAHIIGIAPSARSVNKMYTDSDILDCKMIKLAIRIAKVSNRLTWSAYTMTAIRDTTIPFISKDIAIFEMESPKEKQTLEGMPLCCKTFILFGKHRSTRKVGRILKVSHTTVRHLLDKHLGHLNFQVETGNTVG